MLLKWAKTKDEVNTHHIFLARRHRALLPWNGQKVGKKSHSHHSSVPFEPKVQHETCVHLCGAPVLLWAMEGTYNCPCPPWKAGHIYHTTARCSGQRERLTHSPKSEMGTAECWRNAWGIIALEKGPWRGWGLILIEGPRLKCSGVSHGKLLCKGVLGFSLGFESNNAL